MLTRGVPDRGFAVRDFDRQTMRQLAASEFKIPFPPDSTKSGFLRAEAGRTVYRRHGQKLALSPSVLGKKSSGEQPDDKSDNEARPKVSHVPSSVSMLQHALSWPGTATETASCHAGRMEIASGASCQQRPKAERHSRHLSGLRQDGRAVTTTTECERSAYLPRRREATPCRVKAVVLTGDLPYSRRAVSFNPML